MRRGMVLVGEVGEFDESVLAFTDLLLRRRLGRASSLSPASPDDEVEVLGDGLLVGNGLTPPFVINATPRRCSGSAESNFDGRNTIGRVEPGRWKACGWLVLVHSLKALLSLKMTHDSLGMQALDHRHVLSDIFVVAQHHSHRYR